METARVDLYWIPLGAGGAAAVRVSGRVYEGIQARREGRRPRALYHTALEVRLPEGRFVIENAWPSPDDDLAARGVVVAGPVWSRRAARLRWFRYEVRCWRDGVILDAGEAVGGPVPLSDDPAAGRSLLAAVPTVPPLLWGRRLPGTAEMWNSNSVIAYLLARGGLDPAACRVPDGGRAPGWETGIAIARRRDIPVASRLAGTRRG